MSMLAYKGVTTKRVYWFNQFNLPAGTSLNGWASQTPFTFNAETLVPCNRDGSPMRGYTGPTPVTASQTSVPTPGIGTTYDTFAQTSTWEQQ